MHTYKYKTVTISNAGEDGQKLVLTYILVNRCPQVLYL